MPFEPINQQGGMNPKTKSYLQIGLFIGIAYVIFRVVKKEVIKQKFKRELGNESTLTDNELGNTGGLVLSPCGDYDPAPDAEILRDAMENNAYYIFGNTDEDAIWRTLQNKTCWQRNCIRNSFNQWYGDGSLLFDWFDGEFWGEPANLSRAKGYFNCVEEPFE